MKKETQFRNANDVSCITKTDIQEEQTYVIDQFLQFYKEQGYQLVEPGSILAEDDKSVIFTGATITPLKKYIKNGVPYPGLCLVQKCLRTKRLDDMTDLSIIPEWTHYFTMCGILSASSRIEEVSCEAYEFLITRIKIRKDNLLIEASSNDQDLFSYWNSKGIQIVENTHPEKYYRWQYGIPHVSGRGINILLRFNDTDSYRDLGNVISIENNEGKGLAYEFGFGLESLLSKQLGFKKPMEASLVSAVIPYKEGLQEKFINTLMAAVVLFHHGIEPGRGKEKHVLKKLVKGMSFLRRKMGISLDQIKDWSCKFEQVEFNHIIIGEKLIFAIKTYENQLIKYTEYANNQVHAHKLRNTIFDEKLIEKLRKTGEIMGILPSEVNDTINILLG